MVGAMRRLVLLSLALSSALFVSTAVVACGGDDDDDDEATIDSGTGGAADAGTDVADAADDEADASDPHGFAPR